MLHHRVIQYTSHNDVSKISSIWSLYSLTCIHYFHLLLCSWSILNLCCHSIAHFLLVTADTREFHFWKNVYLMVNYACSIIFVHTVFTVYSGKTSKASTLVGIDVINTFTLILTWTAKTFVDIYRSILGTVLCNVSIAKTKYDFLN